MMSSMIMQSGSTFLRNAKQKISLMKKGFPKLLGSRKSHLKHLQRTREKKKGQQKNRTAKMQRKGKNILRA